MVFGEVDDAVFAGDVGGGDDGELVPGDGGVVVDGEDAAAGDGAADGGAVPHAGEGDVVDVLGAAQDLGEAFFADGGAAYDLVVVWHSGLNFSCLGNSVRIERIDCGVIQELMWRTGVFCG